MTRQIFVDKVMSLLFNMLSRLVITFFQGVSIACQVDLNQIPYDYTVEVKNRFKELDLIDRVPDELWTEVRDIYRRQGSRPSPWKRNAKKQNGCLRRPYKLL